MPKKIERISIKDLIANALILVFCAALLWFSGFGIGIWQGVRTSELAQAEREPQVRYVTVEKPIWHEVPIVEYQEVPVVEYREVEVEKVVEVPLECEDWESLDELKEFLDEHEDEFFVQLLAGKDGMFQLSGQCVGYAMGLREVAAQYGKNLEIQCLSPREYEKVFHAEKDGYHAVNMAIVGYELYYIEPKTRIVQLGAYIP